MSDTSTRTRGFDANEAGRLVRFGLMPRLRPARDADYTHLVLRYQTDPAFARLVVGFAGGQGLSVLDCDRLEGLVLTPTDDSPFRTRLSDYVSIPGTEIRLLHGLVQLAIAATAYPTSAALEDPTRLVSVTASQVYHRIRGLVDQHKEAGRDDPPEDDPEAERIWRLVGRLRAADITPDGRETSYNVMGAIKKALRWLEEQGLADSVDDDTWRLRERYRLNVLSAASDTFELLQAQLAAGSA